MTPKEKAEELFQLYLPFVESLGNIKDIKYRCKQCALIAVDEILKAVDNPDETYLMKHSVEYWSQVKQEIENL
jgi:hypothetical protein